MATERFPRAKYIRQLAAMANDFKEWQIGYAHAAEDHPDDWLGSKLEERSSVLDDAIFQVNQLRNTLWALPRLR
jgi:hypothetical protein